MESVKWLTLLLQSDPTPPPTRKLMEKSGQTETPSYTWCCIWIMGSGRGGVTLLHCIVIVMNNKHSGAQVKGSAAALLGFFVAFSLGRRVKWPSIWLGGAGGTFFLSWIQTVQSAFPPDWDLITTQTTALPDVWIALMHISFFISQSTCKVIRHHYMRSGRHADELAKTGSPSVSNDDVI